MNQPQNRTATVPECGGTGQGGAPDLTFLRFRPGAGLGRRRRPGAATSRPDTPGGPTAPPDLPSPGQSLSRDPSLALEPKAEPRVAPPGYRAAILCAGLGARRETGAACAVGAGLGAGQPPAVQPFSPAGGPPRAAPPRLAGNNLPSYRQDRHECVQFLRPAGAFIHRNRTDSFFLISQAFIERLLYKTST